MEPSTPQHIITDSSRATKSNQTKVVSRNFIVRLVGPLGIKVVICIILLAFCSVNIIQNSQNLNGYLSNIQAGQNNATEDQIIGDKKESEEQILADGKQQIMHNVNATFHAKKTTSHFVKVAKYTFPSVQERLQYYMGDWYNKSDWTVPDCKLLHEETDYHKVSGRNVMLYTNSFKECMDMDSGVNIKRYCKDAYRLINNTLDEADNNRWLVCFGDRTHDIEKTLPFISKARQSALSFHPQPIVWLLNEYRHYHDLETYHRDIVKRGKEVPWSEKLSKVFWRGSTTFNKAAGTTRLDILARWINYDDNHTDIAFSNIVQMSTDFKREYIARQYFRKKQSPLEMSRHKYLLSVEGNDVATGLKWMLYSNSVVFMARPTVATWAMEDLLLPFVHYVPLANDYSNLLEMVKWAEEHDEACQEISKRATEFIEHLWISAQAKRDTKYLQKTLVRSYVNQFDDALSKCTGPRKDMLNSSSVHLPEDTARDAN